MTLWVQGFLSPRITGGVDKNGPSGSRIPMPRPENFATIPTAFHGGHNQIPLPGDGDVL